MTVFRTRQAPSPTGFLHLGTARTVLFTKLFAMINKGTWYLRLEDTDRSRLNSDAVVPLLSALQTLGLSPDEGITLDPEGQKDNMYQIYQKGEYGPYIQSERLKMYHLHAQKLIDMKLAYWSYLSETEKEELVQIKAVTKKPVNYYKINLEKFGEEALYASVEKALTDPREPALRYRLQREEVIECVDELLGSTKFDLALEEDFTILKSDGFPTYHLAHLVDDRLMETTVVIRSQEWFPSIPKHITMFKDYWGQAPQYMHVPFILGATGNKKMSKRDGNVNMQDYLDKGYLPEALVNYLAFLGWNPGTEKELYLEAEDFSKLNQGQRLQKLINNIAQDFGIEKLSKSPARFNLEKLDWFNKQYIKMLSLEEFALQASVNKYAQTYPGKHLRTGDYVYFVDTNKQKVFLSRHTDFLQEETQINHPIGGGRNEGEDSVTSLIREIAEETEGKVTIDANKLIKIANIRFLSGQTFLNDGNQTYDGKDMCTYFYPLSEEALAPYTMDDGGVHEYKWFDLSDVIGTNTYLTYPVWQHFCSLHNLPCFAPTVPIIQTYLGWILDKNRVTVLSEFGSESQTILDWQQPSLDLVTWKKITPEESLANLQHITHTLYQSTDPETEAEIVHLHEQLYTYARWNTINPEEVFYQLVAAWEKKLKKWLTDNQKDVGSYLWPLRVALSGKVQSPSPFEILAVLDQETVLQRLEKVLGSENK